jgi:NADH dehydrogenase
LEKALLGCDGVHINLSGGPRPEDFDRIEHRGTANVAMAAARAGVRRLTYLSGISARPENREFAPAAAKLAAADAIIASGVPFTIFRPSWFFESLRLFVRGKSAATLGGRRVKFRWLAADDYADIVSRSYDQSETVGKTLDLLGPVPMTMLEALTRYCAIAHPELRPRTMPIWLARTVAVLTGNRTLKNVLPAMSYFDQPHDEGDPSEANRLFGPPRTTLEEWARRQSGC